MKRQSQQPKAYKSAGYTIIELMFVLAIAGVILLLVFEALPALERSSRNNQRKQDVTTILRAVSQYELKDSGNFPLDCPASPNACSDQLSPNSNDYFLYYSRDKLTFYTDIGTTGNHVVLAAQTSGATPSPNPVTDTERVFVYNYQKCSASGGGSTPQGAGFSDVVALYALETGSSGHTSQCQQL